ncbi:glycosyltransferase family 25 protein [Alteromonas aestuariivivens]|uniref:glycosyltransferase family 25 protein n=1 Tax=Alteromonas aestuariivivens TaxID=1938339 RepID=UPI0015F25B47|nr:glycosyltransferase family 25 protein [Alteromonas aestuariivivens]
MYLINLDSSVDRYEKSKARLTQAGVTFNRFSAVHGASLAPQELNGHYSENLNRQQYHKALTKGEIGCYMSHRKVWQLIASGSSPYGVVLEDDIEIVGNLPGALKTIDALKFDWDIIKLSGYKNAQRKVVFAHSLSDAFKLVIHAKPMTGCAAYALKKQAAQQLIAATEKFGRPVDTDIQHFWEKGISVFSLMPYPVRQDLSYDSDIKSMQGRQKSHKLRRIKQQLVTFFKNKSAIEQQIRKFKSAIK